MKYNAVYLNISNEQNTKQHCKTVTTTTTTLKKITNERFLLLARARPFSFA